jgi:membrane dipeptidase
MMPIIDGDNDLPMQPRGRFVTGWADWTSTGRNCTPASLGCGPAEWAGSSAPCTCPSDLSEPEAVAATMEQIDAVYRMAAAHPDDFMIAYGRTVSATWRNALPVPFDHRPVPPPPSASYQSKHLRR